MSGSAVGTLHRGVCSHRGAGGVCPDRRSGLGCCSCSTHQQYLPEAHLSRQHHPSSKGKEKKISARPVGSLPRGKQDSYPPVPAQPRRAHSPRTWKSAR